MSDDSLNATVSTERSPQSELSRSQIFNIYLDRKDDEDSVFQLSAMHFTKFSCKNICFYFKPSDIVDHVVETVRFKCKLRFDGKYWLIRSNSFPVKCKWPIYRLFWNKLYLNVTDENLMDIIGRIQGILEKWSFLEDKRRLEKFQEYCEGNSDIELDEDDEILFLTEEQRFELQEKRWSVMKRMIPPEEYDIRKHLKRVRRRASP